MTTNETLRDKGEMLGHLWLNHTEKLIRRMEMGESISIRKLSDYSETDAEIILGELIISRSFPKIKRIAIQYAIRALNGGLYPTVYRFFQHP